MIRPLRVHHATLEVSDMQSAVGFLTEVLGFVEVERHDIPGARAWAGADRGFQIHLAPAAELPAGMAEAASGPGLSRLVPHVAFEIDDVEQAKEALRGKGIEFIDFGQVLFVADPDGNLFELRAPDATMTIGEDRGRR